MKKKNGFTLVELLAVIVVLAIILAITIPGFTRILKASKEKSFINQGLLVEEAVKKYELKNELTFGEDGIAKIAIADLVSANEIEEFFGPNGELCEGEVWVTKVGNIQEYENVMKCGTYETTDYSLKIDEESPLITLNGSAVIDVYQGSTFVDLGIIIEDNVDDEATLQGLKVVGGDIVDTGVIGEYIRTYNVTDTSDNIAIEQTRTINVIPDNIASLEQGRYYTGIVKDSGKLYMVGRNSVGSFGDGTSTPQLTPVEITITGETIASVSLGDMHTGIVTTSGKLYMTGYNFYGQLGDGTTDDKSIPVQVIIPDETIASVTAGYSHTGIITTSGKLFVAGNNNDGQLGDGTTIQKETPFEIEITGETIKSISLGAWNTGIVTNSGRLYMIGDGSEGQLGDGTYLRKSTPVEILIPGETVAMVSLESFGHTGIVTNTGKLYMTGRNEYGQLGNGTTNGTNTPFQVTITGEEIASISGGAWHTGILTTTGKLYMTGGNVDGELGDGTFAPKSTPVEISIFGETIASANIGGFSHTGIITDSGKLYLAGQNTFGQIGDGTQVDKETPVEISIP